MKARDLKYVWSQMDAKNIKYIWSRGRRERGTVTGKTRPCQLEGCTGVRIGVRWPNKAITRPCSKGLFFYADGVSAKIL